MSGVWGWIGEVEQNGDAKHADDSPVSGDDPEPVGDGCEDRAWLQAQSPGQVLRLDAVNQDGRSREHQSRCQVYPGHVEESLFGQEVEEEPSDERAHHDAGGHIHRIESYAVGEHLSSHQVRYKGAAGDLVHGERSADDKGEQDDLPFVHVARKYKESSYQRGDKVHSPVPIGGAACDRTSRRLSQ